jgi:hypothetical protein
MRRLIASKTAAKRWSLGSVSDAAPEQIVAAHFEAGGAQASWCEGGTMNLLIKAAALDVLTELNIFQDRQDAVRRYLEAQLTLLQEHKGHLLASIHAVDQGTLARNIDEILSDAFIQVAYPRVTAAFLRRLASTVAPGFLAQVAALFFEKPYEYRAGWPDLTVVGEGLQFVEVKTTDLMHESQIRFAKELAAPLGLQCEVVQLCSD